MIGVAMIVPYWPGFVIVNVPPRTSSGVSSRARARRARSLTRAAETLDRELVGAVERPGTISPSSPSDTAIPRLTS